MEKKTMGSFIAALRRAAGLTQKELAEKLNVSDKSVSRWERDESAPDLSLIPVIAEIFEVSCDELLRGERLSLQEQACPLPDKRAEKQRRHLIQSRLLRYRNQSLLSWGLCFLGLAAALTVNFALLRAYLALAAGGVFLICAVLLQFFFLNGALAAAADLEGSEPDVGNFRQTAVLRAEWLWGISLALFAGLLVLIQTNDAYAGLSAQIFWPLFFVCAAGAAVLLLVLFFFINQALFRKETFGLTEKEVQTRSLNARLLSRSLLFWAAGCAVVLFCANALTGFGTPTRLCQGTSFDSWDEFKSYMETPFDFDVSLDPSSDSNAVWYDENGNVISEEEALTEQILDENGNEVCSFLWKNRSVIHLRYDGSGRLPVTVITNADYQKALKTADLLLAGASIVCILSIAAPLWYFFKKRQKS